MPRHGGRSASTKHARRIVLSGVWIDRRRSPQTTKNWLENNLQIPIVQQRLWQAKIPDLHETVYTYLIVNLNDDNISISRPDYKIYLYA